MSDAKEPSAHHMRLARAAAALDLCIANRGVAPDDLVLEVALAMDECTRFALSLREPPQIDPETPLCCGQCGGYHELQTMRCPAVVPVEVERLKGELDHAKRERDEARAMAAAAEELRAVQVGAANDDVRKARARLAAIERAARVVLEANTHPAWNEECVVSVTLGSLRALARAIEGGGECSSDSGAGSGTKDTGGGSAATGSGSASGVSVSGSTGARGASNALEATADGAGESFDRWHARNCPAPENETISAACLGTDSVRWTPLITDKRFAGRTCREVWEAETTEYRERYSALAESLRADVNGRREELRNWQARVRCWVEAAFGVEVADDQTERSHRFLEEALEVVQACGATAIEAHQLVDYVFGRPVGALPQEVGGVMTTLAALCSANRVEMAQAAEIELARCWVKIEAIRAKQAAKPKHSPLPGLAEHPAPSGGTEASKPDPVAVAVALAEARIQMDNLGIFRLGAHESGLRNVSATLLRAIEALAESREPLRGSGSEERR